MMAINSVPFEKISPVLEPAMAVSNAVILEGRSLMIVLASFNLPIMLALLAILVGKGTPSFSKISGASRVESGLIAFPSSNAIVSIVPAPAIDLNL
ncbi:hypothetical protein D3C86_1702320 [compost metagenome]